MTMSYLTAVLLGLVQGVTEFLPVSSSGHLAIAEQLLNLQGASNVPDFFDVLLHLGTLVAVFAAYWDDIRDMIVEFFAGIGDVYQVIWRIAVFVKVFARADVHIAVHLSRIGADDFGVEMPCKCHGAACLAAGCRPGNAEIMWNVECRMWNGLRGLQFRGLRGL